MLGHPYGPNTERGVVPIHRRRRDAGRRCCTRTRTPARWTSRSIPRIPKQSTQCCGPRAKGLGRTANGRAQAADCSNRPTAARPGSSSRAACPTPAEGLGRIGIGIAPSDPNRMYALVEAKTERGLSLRRRGQQPGSASIPKSAWKAAVRDFACVRVDPKNKDVIYVANTSTYRSTDAGRNVHGHQRRTRRRRLSHHLDQSRPSRNYPAGEPIRAPPSRSMAAQPGAPGTTSRPRSSIT